MFKTHGALAAALVALAMIAACGPAGAADLVYQPGGVTAVAPDGSGVNVALTGKRFEGDIVLADKPGEAQLHLEGIANIVVLDGNATLVYGGDMAGSHMISEAEFRGTGLAGDTKSLELHKGDIVQIPAGMPNWIKPQGSIRYVLFKVPGQKD